MLGQDEDVSDDVLEFYLESAKYIYLNLVYPFNQDIIELPNDRAQFWQIKCAIELYNLGDDSNLKSYSENGLSESYYKAGLSQTLLNELPPAQAGVIY